MSHDAAAKPQGARTVGRVLRALELFAAQSGALRLTDIARELALPASSAHVLVRELVRYDYARPTGADRRYAAGPGLVLLGARVRAGLRIVTVARPIIEALAAATGENVYLGVRQARGIAYADSVEAESGVMARFPLGTIRPLHASSPGKVFLAFDAAAISPERLLGAAPLVAFTRHTTTDRAQLRKQIDEVRLRGYAINEQEAVDGAYGISAPVFTADGALAGCVTLGLPGVRFKQRRALAIEKTCDAAREISRRLGVADWDALLRPLRKPR